MKYGNINYVPTVLVLIYLLFILISNLYWYPPIWGYGEKDTNPLQGCAIFVSLSSTADRSGEYVYDYDESTGVRISVFNNGPSEVRALTYSIEGTKEILSVENKTDAIIPASSKWLIIPYDMEEYGDIIRIVVTPHYQHADELRACPEGRLEVLKQRTA